MLPTVESASGVRVRFSSPSGVPDDVRAKAWSYAQAYLDLVRRAPAAGTPTLVLGYDGRPNGPEICALMARAWRAGGARVAWLGRVTTPILESAIRSLKAQGGAMVTASHNPFDAVGGYWNGWKFCTPAKAFPELPVAEGALLPPAAMKSIIAQACAGTSSAPKGPDAALGGFPCGFEPGDAATPAPAPGAPAEYPVPKNLLSEKVFFGYLSEVREELGLGDNAAFGLFRRKLGDLTPEARTLIFDCVGGGACGWNKAVAERFGFSVVEIDARPGTFSRQIEPVGPGLVPAMREVFVQRAVLACCFDADADRGNVVAHVEIHPQYVAAVNVAARLSAAMRAGVAKVAVVAHCAASPLIAQTAKLLGAKLEYVETGEVNVVGKMRAFAAGGYTAIGVEAYNGGTVFPGSRCRDGLLTALSTAALLCDADSMGLLMSRLGFSGTPANLPELAAALPRFHHLQGNVKFGAATVAVEDAEIRIAKPFSKEKLPALKEKLDDLVADKAAWPGFEVTMVRNLLGGEHVEGIVEGRMARVRTGNFSGGYRIELADADGRPAAAWFRSSVSGPSPGRRKGRGPSRRRSRTFWAGRRRSPCGVRRGDADGRLLSF